MQLDVSLPEEFSKEIQETVVKTVADTMSQVVGISKFPEWMDKGTASKFLGVSRVTFDKIIKKYHVPYTLLGGSYFFSKAELNKFMLSQQNK